MSPRTVTVGGSSSWQSTSISRYAVNTSGVKSVNPPRDTVVISPRSDYRTASLSTINKVSVRVSGSNQTWYVTAAT